MVIKVYHHSQGAGGSRLWLKILLEISLERKKSAFWWLTWCSSHDTINCKNVEIWNWCIALENDVVPLHWSSHYTQPGILQTELSELCLIKHKFSDPFKQYIGLGAPYLTIWVWTRLNLFLSIASGIFPMQILLELTSPGLYRYTVTGSLFSILHPVFF